MSGARAAGGRDGQAGAPEPSALPASGLPRPVLSGLSTRVGLSEARARVLEAIEAAPEGVTAAELSTGLGLHHNTVREHLEALVEDGLVTATTRPTGRRGRPALRYTSTAPDPAHVLASYTHLLNAVAHTLGEGPQAREAATRIGVQWARSTPTPPTPQPAEAAEPAGSAGASSPTDSALPSQPAPAAQPAQTGPALAHSLLPHLTAMGLAPQACPNGTLQLTACPLLAAGTLPHPLVCTMHEAFLDTVLADSGLAPTPCRTRLTITPMTGAGCEVSVEVLPGAPQEPSPQEAL